MLSEFIDNLGTRPQKGSPSLLQTDQLDTSKAERKKSYSIPEQYIWLIFRYENNFRSFCFGIFFQALFGFCVLQTKKGSMAK